MTRKKKLLLTLVVVGIVGATASLGAYSAFTATTTNSGNTITAGTVEINQHAGATTLYSAAAQGPGASVTKCVRVTYTGSLAASVKLFISSGAVSNGGAFNLTVERGSGLTTLDNTMSCAGFSVSSTAYTGTLGGFAQTYAGGYDGKAAGAAWGNGDSVDYRFTISVVDDATPNAHTTALASGAHSFTWEARNN